MKNVFELNNFGKRLQQCSVKTKLVDIYTDAQIYEIVDKIPEYGLKKGDMFYLDKCHNDHIEVFRNNRCINVLNLDGLVNESKALKALGEGRKLKVK